MSALQVWTRAEIVRRASRAARKVLHGDGNCGCTRCRAARRGRVLVQQAAVSQSRRGRRRG